MRYIKGIFKRKKLNEVKDTSTGETYSLTDAELMAEHANGFSVAGFSNTRAPKSYRLDFERVSPTCMVLKLGFDSVMLGFDEDGVRATRTTSQSDIVDTNSAFLITTSNSYIDVVGLQEATDDAYNVIGYLIELSNGCEIVFSEGERFLLKGSHSEALIDLKFRN